jgi:hypothetical protein
VKLRYVDISVRFLARMAGVVIMTNLADEDIGAGSSHHLVFDFRTLRP